MQGTQGLIYPLNMNDSLHRNGSYLSAYKSKKHYLNVDSHHNKNHNIFNGDGYRSKASQYREAYDGPAQIQQEMIRNYKNSKENQFNTIQPPQIDSINDNLKFDSDMEHRIIAEKYIHDSNPNGRIEYSGSKIIPRGDLFQRIVPLHKDGSYYNPTNYNPHRYQYHSKVGGSSQAGYPTNYGLNKPMEGYRYDPEIGQLVKYESGTALFASGKGTGQYMAGNVARLRTPIKVNYEINQNYSDLNNSHDGLPKGSQSEPYSRFNRSPQPQSIRNPLSNAGYMLSSLQYDDFPTEWYTRGIGRHDSNPHSMINLKKRHYMQR